MTDYYENCRWFLRDSPSQPYVEVTRTEWLDAEYDAGFRGGNRLQGVPSTAAWTVGTSMAGVMVYPNEALPEGCIEMDLSGAEVSYEWGHQLRHDPTVAWGAVRESFEDNHADAETRARQEVEAGIRLRGYGTARLVKRRVVTYDWEEAPSE